MNPIFQWKDREKFLNKTVVYCPVILNVIKKNTATCCGVTVDNAVGQGGPPTVERRPE